MSSRILVFGRSGHLARALARHPRPPAALEFLGRDSLDLTADPNAAEAAILTRRPAAVINAAAYTAVDRAETEIAACRALNVLAPAAMARASAALDIPLIHLSSDYVFDGAKGAPYMEDDMPAPLSAYGSAKRDGEIAVLASPARAAVLRTSGVFSIESPCFPLAMLRLAAARDEVSVVCDQKSCPTTADSAADAVFAVTRHLVEGDPGALGLFHAAGDCGLSWAEFAEKIFTASRRRGGPSAAVRPVSAAEWNAPAARPPDSRLACARLERLAKWRCGDLEEGLDVFLTAFGVPAA